MKVSQMKAEMGQLAANSKGIKNQELYEKLLELYKTKNKSAIKKFYRNQFKK